VPNVLGGYEPSPRAERDLSNVGVVNSSSGGSLSNRALEETESSAGGELADRESAKNLLLDQTERVGRRQADLLWQSRRDRVELETAVATPSSAATTRPSATASMMRWAASCGLRSSISPPSSTLVSKNIPFTRANDFALLP